eukprot:g26374.t1
MCCVYACVKWTDLTDAWVWTRLRELHEDALVSRLLHRRLYRATVHDLTPDQISPASTATATATADPTAPSLTTAAANASDQTAPATTAIAAASDQTAPAVDATGQDTKAIQDDAKWRHMRISINLGGNESCPDFVSGIRFFDKQGRPCQLTAADFPIRSELCRWTRLYSSPEGLYDW